MTKTGRFNMRVDKDLLGHVESIAKKRGVSLTHLVDQFFRALVLEETQPRTEEDLGVEQA